MAADGVRGQVAVSVNLDAETLWLGLFAESVRMPKTLSMGEYGPRHGLQRVLYALRAGRPEAHQASSAARPCKALCVLAPAAGRGCS